MKDRLTIFLGKRTSSTESLYAFFEKFPESEWNLHGKKMLEAYVEFFGVDYEPFKDGFAIDVATRLSEKSLQTTTREEDTVKPQLGQEPKVRSTPSQIKTVSKKVTKVTSLDESLPLAMGYIKNEK